MKREPTLKVTLTAPVNETETVYQSGGHGDDGPYVKATTGTEYTLSVDHTVSGLEAVAEWLAELLDRRDRERPDMVRRELPDDEWLEEHRAYFREGEMTVDLHAASGAVYLAAHECARRATANNMSGSQYGPERVLAGWIEGDMFGAPDADDVLTFAGSDPAERGRNCLSEAAWYAFWCYVCDQTEPYEEVDADNLPPRDEAMTARRDRRDPLTPRDD